jgi:hypothetical protein
MSCPGINELSLHGCPAKTDLKNEEMKEKKPC